MFITVFPEAEASLNRSIERDLSWEQLVEKLSDFDRTQTVKDKCQLLVPARFADRTKGKTESNVRDVSLATLDVDDIDEATLDAFIEWLVERDYKALIYTTWNHGDAVRGIGKKGEAITPTCKLRVLLPLTRPVRLGEWSTFWKSYNDLFFGLADTQCKDPNRGYFIPAIPKKHLGTEVEDLYYVRELQGSNAVDVDTLLHRTIEDVGKSAEAFAESEVDKERIPLASVKRFAAHLSKKQQVLGVKMLEALKGEIFEIEGSRNNTLFQFAQELAKTFPKGRIADLSEPFSAALANMLEDDEDSPTLEIFQAQILRAQLSVQKERQEKKLKADQEEQLAQEEDADESRALSKEKLLDFLKLSGREKDVENFKSLIWSGNKDLFVFDGTGYTGPANLDAIYTQSKQTVEPLLKKLGFRKDYFVPSGEDGTLKRMRKTKDQLIDEYGAYATRGVVYNMNGQSYYDSDNHRLHLSSLTKSDLKPEYVPAVDKWIEAVCPTRELAETFRIWLSLVENTDRALAALVFVGPEGIGKSAFSAGLAKLWKSTATGEACIPVSANSVFEDFNDNFLTCPIVLADEEMPRDYRGRVMTTKLRSFIAANEHEISIKFRSKMILKGAARLVIALNNIKNFRFNEDFSGQDVEAVSRRFLIIHTEDYMHERAKKLFDYKKFVEQGQLAKHVRYLAQRVAKPAPEERQERFGVVTDSKGGIQNSSPRTQFILSWIAKRILETRITDPDSLRVPSDQLKPVMVLPGRQICISSIGIFENWETVFGSKTGFRPRSHYEVLDALESLLEPMRLATKLDDGKRKYRLYSLRGEALIEAFRGLNVPRDHAEALMDVHYDLDVLFPNNCKATDESRASRSAAIQRISQGAFEEFEDEEEDEELREIEEIQAPSEFKPAQVPADPEIAKAMAELLSMCDSDPEEVVEPALDDPEQAE